MTFIIVDDYEEVIFKDIEVKEEARLIQLMSEDDAVLFAIKPRDIDELLENDDFDVKGRVRYSTTAEETKSILGFKNEYIWIEIKSLKEIVTMINHDLFFYMGMTLPKGKAIMDFGCSFYIIEQITYDEFEDSYRTLVVKENTRNNLKEQLMKDNTYIEKYEDVWCHKKAVLV